MSHHVTIVEVGPRDGLQVEAEVLPVAERVRLIESLADAGARRIEAASFVHPRYVPQMAGAEEILAMLRPRADTSYIGLVLNERGLDRALETTVDEVNFVVAASDGYNLSNARVTSAETMAQLDELIPAARRAGRKTSVTISVSFGDPYDGEVPVGQVVAISERCAAAGADEIALADTIGVATPRDVSQRIAAVRPALGGNELRVHFHDTRRTAMANVVAALDSGVTVIDASVGGLGGSPFAPGAGGNVATEDLLYMLHRMGYTTDVELSGVLTVAAGLERRLDHALPGALTKAGDWPG